MKNILHTKLPVLILMAFLGGCFVLFPQHAHATSCGSYSVADPASSTLIYGTVVGADGKCWLDRNLGASKVATAVNDYKAYGSLFQWGRLADGHQLIKWTNSTTGTTVYGTTATLSTTTTPVNSLFITSSSGNEDWMSSSTNSLWQGVSGTNNPCPTGFYVPTIAEWATLAASSSITSLATAYSSALKITANGGEHYYGGLFNVGGTFAYYWSSSISGVNTYYLLLSTAVNTTIASPRGEGDPVRCVSDLSSFGASAPTVTTSPPTLVSTSTMTLNGNITADGTASSTIRGFAWGTNSALSGGDTATTTESGTFGIGTFTANLASLTPNTLYYFRAYAVNSAGTSTGAILSSTTLPWTNPDAPTSLLARNTGGQVVLNWAAPASNGGSAITNYKIYRNTSSPATTLLATIGNLTTYNDQTIVAPNTTYYYRVTATNSVGEGAYSNEVNTMPQRAVINEPPNYLSSGNGLVGYWTFDGKNMKTNVADSSGKGNNGSLFFGASGNTSTSSMQAVGKIGQALSFDGVDDYVNTTFTTALNDLTICMWFNSSGSAGGGYDRLADKNYTSLFLSRNSTSANSFGGAVLQPTVGNWKFVTLKDGIWHHICLWRQGTTFKVIGDGGAVTNTGTAGSGALDTTTLKIGGISTGNKFKGSIDDVRIYNRALSAAEVAQLYNAGSAKVSVSNTATTANGGGNLANGLVGYWTFDGKNLKTNVTDSSGQGNNGNLYGATTTVAGKIGQALSFNGSTSYISGPTYNGVMTVSFWMKPNTTTQQILSLNATLASTSVSSGTISANNFTSPTIYVDGAVSSTVSNTNWHFIAITTGTAINASAITIGKTATGYYGGSLDDVRIYNRALSAAEVLQLYRLGTTKVKP